MKRIVFLVAALAGFGIHHTAAMAQTAPSDAAVISAAQPAIDALLRTLPQGTALTPTQVFTDTLGQAHVRLAQSYKGIPVFEGDAIVHVDAATGRVLGTTNATLPFAALNVTPSVSATRAADVSRTHFAQAPGLANQKDLAILVRDGAASLSWKVHSEGSVGNGHADTIAFVGAHDGKVLRAWNNLHTGTAVAGTGKGMYMDVGGDPVTLDQTGVSTFYLRNPGTPYYYTCDMKGGRNTCSYITSTTSTVGTGTITTSGPNAGADAQYGAEKTLSYYKTILGRNGIDNANMQTYSRVHYSKSYENAFWSDSCKCMTYGDGASTFYPLVSMDVAGHEMSHGVTSRSANLTYSGESGGLNEATSDIFGTMVEFYANGARDVPDYKIGEMIWKANWSTGTLKPDKALRYMYQPSLDKASPDFWSSTVGSLDVHYSSGIANHFFYLLAEGSAPTAAVPTGSPTYGNVAVTALGRDMAQRIWYRALTVYMTTSTNYKGARAATIQAAADLYGTTAASAVAAAWTAVNVTP